MNEIEKLNAYCFALIGICRSTDAEEMNVLQENVTYLGKSIGNWRITVSKEGAKNWIIWSNEHNAWWGADHKGYVAERKVAGRYSYDEALKIVKGANIGLKDVPNEAMVMVTDDE